MQESEKWTARLWKQLKSPKVWVTVIATALASLAVSLYNEHRAEEKLEGKNVHVAENLKTEIGYRATRTKEYLGNLERYMESGEVDELNEALSDLLLQIAGQMTTGGWAANLLSEYADQSMASLLSQLKQFSKPDSRMQKILDAAVASTVELQSMGADIHSNKPKTTVTELIEGTKRQLEDLGAVTGKSYLTNGEISD